MVRRRRIFVILAFSLQTFAFGLTSTAVANVLYQPQAKTSNAPSAMLIESRNGGQDTYPIKVLNKEVGIEIKSNLDFHIIPPLVPKQGENALSAASGYFSQIRLAGRDGVERFRVVSSRISEKFEDNEYGKCETVSFTALSQDSILSENIELIRPIDRGNVIICKSSLKNESQGSVEVSSYALLSSLLDAKSFGADSSYKFWSFQGGSYPERYDWIFPITRYYERENYQGMNAPDYGGGIPVVDLWTKSMGIAFSVINRTPQFISLPVRVVDSGKVSFSIEDSNSTRIDPHKSVELIRYAIITHHGDFFNGLRTFSDLMQAEGFHFPKAPSDAYQPEWCAWGYGRDFNKEQILKSLPTVKKLGFGWVTIDDGWQNDMGDWEPNLAKFPGGEKDFEAFVDSIHSFGLKVRLWWSPLSAQDSTYSAEHYPSRIHEYGFNTQSKLALEHPDWFITDTTGNRVRVSWWNSYLLCPALPAVRHYYEDFVRTAIVRWKIDGFKLDGQDLNMVPECFNEAHHHRNALASVDAVPEFFKDLYDESQELKKGFLIQLCPCGTNFSIYNLPFVNQTVASDPEDSWQVRLKGKTFRALYGSHSEAYSSDHVELTNHIWDNRLQKFILHGKPDFASALAVGAVPASKFTITGIEQEDSSLAMTPPRLKYYEKWMDIYRNEELDKGVYLNLYDIAYDKPETHVIKRGSNYYYFFFAKGHFKGKVSLRGLTAPRYRAYNLYTGKLLGEVRPGKPTLEVSFNHYMLVKLVQSVTHDTKEGLE